MELDLMEGRIKTSQDRLWPGLAAHGAGWLCAHGVNDRSH